MSKYADMSQSDLIDIFNFNSYPSTVELRQFNHEMNNGFIRFNMAREVVDYLDYCGYNILGFAKPPYNVDNHFCWAIILEDYEHDYEICWCHVADYNIVQWRCSLTKEDFDKVYYKDYYENVKPPKRSSQV